MFSAPNSKLSAHLRWLLMSGAVAVAAPAFADPVNLVQNGDFSNTSAFTTSQGVTVGTNVNAGNLAGWSLTNCSAGQSTCGFQFIVNANLGTSGFYDAVDHHESTFYSTPGAAPDGNANAFMSDATYQTQALYQAVSGLTVGDTYTLKFYQASMQQTGFTGAAQDSWQVGFGNGNSFDTRQSTTMNNSAGGSTPWVQQSMTFVANAASEFLYFFATANQGAQPPFLLLDGVSLADTTQNTPVPEPATIGLIGAGLLGMVAIRRRRRA